MNNLLMLMKKLKKFKKHQKKKNKIKISNKKIYNKNF